MSATTWLVLIQMSKGSHSQNPPRFFAAWLPHTPAFLQVAKLLVQDNMMVYIGKTARLINGP
jgi:hypothetical protein